MALPGLPPRVPGSCPMVLCARYAVSGTHLAITCCQEAQQRAKTESKIAHEEATEKVRRPT
eukprot:2742549-Rhodomonas_salina.2